MCDFIELHKTLHVYNLTHESRENNAVLVLSHPAQSHLAILYEVPCAQTCWFPFCPRDADAELFVPIGPIDLHANAPPFGPLFSEFAALST